MRTRQTLNFANKNGLLVTTLCCVLLTLVSSFNVAAQSTRIANDTVNDLTADDEGRVFWNKFGFTEGGEPWSVRRINTSTGTPVTLREGRTFTGIALASPYVFFFEGPDLMRMYVSGRVTARVAGGAGEALGSAGTLTAKNDYVYWSDSTGIHRLPIDGGTPQDLLRPTHRALWLAVDNTHIYWIEGLTGYWEIRRAPLSGGPSEELYWSGASLSNLAVDESGIFWAQAGARILRGPKAPFSTPTVAYTEARAGRSAGGLVVDSENVYWTEGRDASPTDSLLRRSPKDRSAPIDLAGGPQFRKLALDPSFIYWSDAVGINRLPKRPSAVDATLVSMEITQGIQNLDNQVPLVANKPTIIRVAPSVATDAGGRRDTEVVLHGTRDGLPLPGSPLRSLSGVMAFPLTTSAREDVNSTANFMLPQSWLSGNVRLTAEINPGFSWFPEILASNNTLVRDISFLNKEGMCVVTVPVISDTAPLSIYHITDPTFPEILDRFSTIYPNADIRVRELPTPFGPVDVTGAALHTITWLRPWMVFSDVGSCAVNARRVHVGLVSQDADTRNVAGYSLPGQVAWVKMLYGGSAPQDTPIGGVAMAHEIAHTDWWSHVPGCGASIPFDHGYPYANGVIDDRRRDFGAAFESMVYFGFDRINMSVVAPSSFDFMGYCTPLWISDTHWRELINSFATRPSARLRSESDSIVRVDFRAESSHSVDRSDILYVAGIFQQDNSIEWGPTLRVPQEFLTNELVTELLKSAQQRPGTQSASYSVELLGPEGSVLLTQPFQPIPDSGDLPSPQPNSFSVALPFASGTTEIRVMRDQTELGRISRSNTNAPNLKILSPKVGEAVTNTLKVEWASESAAPFLVQYSNDGGTTWQLLTMNYRSTSIVVPTDNLPGGRNCLVRVLATDPFTAGFAVSEAFSVDTHSPFARITAPRAKQTFVTGVQTPVRGFAYDVEDGSLSGESMHWSVSGVGAIGDGSEALIPDLPPGEYRLTLEVFDSEGQKNSAGVDFVVTNRLSSSYRK